jgi:hypothetical protein
MVRQTNGEIDGKTNNGINSERDDEMGTKGTYKHNIQ